MKKIIIPFTVGIIFASQAFSASFDCKNAHTKTEITICSDKDISASDDKLATLYKKALTLVSHKDDLKLQQRDWIKNVRNACKDNNCLMQVYKDRLVTITNCIDTSKPNKLAKDTYLNGSYVFKHVVSVYHEPKWEDESVEDILEIKKKTKEMYFINFSATFDNAHLCGFGGDYILKGSELRLIPDPEVNCDISCRLVINITNDAFVFKDPGDKCRSVCPCGANAHLNGINFPRKQQ